MHRASVSWKDNNDFYDIQDNSVFLNVWRQFKEGPFLPRYDNPDQHNRKSILKWFVKVGVEELE